MLNRILIIFVAVVVIFQASTTGQAMTELRRLKRQQSYQMMNTAVPVYQTQNTAVTYSPYAIPGYLPNYQGDSYTEIQAIRETQALNAPFFQNIARGTVPQEYMNQQQQQPIAYPGYNNQQQQQQPITYSGYNTQMNYNNGYSALPFAP